MNIQKMTLNIIGARRLMALTIFGVFYSKKEEWQCQKQGFKVLSLR